MKVFRVSASLAALVALSSCNEIKSLNGTMTLNETDPVILNDAGGGQVQLQQGPTQVSLEKGVLTVHNNLTTLTLKVPKGTSKDLSNFKIDGAALNQPVNITATRATVAVDHDATPTTESCYRQDYAGTRYDRRCSGPGYTGEARVWTCSWGTRPVTYYSSTNTDQFTVRFTRISDGHEVANFVARMDFTHSEGSSRNYCQVDYGRNWDVCDYRCVPTPRPVVIVVDRPSAPPRRPDAGPGRGGPGRPRPNERHIGLVLPPPAEMTTLPPPPVDQQ